MDALRQAYKVDKTKCVEGVWVTPERLVGVQDAMQFKLARMGVSNPKFRAAATEYALKNRNQQRLGQINVEAQREHMIRVFCETVLIDWRNIKDPSGKVVDYDVQLGIVLMEELEDLFEELLNKAQQQDLFRAEANKEDLGK